MNVSAITVCVNYADLFKLVAANNRKFFDRWLIITDPDDHDTASVCSQFGFEILTTKRFYDNGAIFNKAKALNAGLQALGTDTWCLAIDSDIYLPPEFRDMLDSLSLCRDSLYGMEGLRICRTMNEFASLVEKQPWIPEAHSGEYILGYFNLFHSANNHQYPEDESNDASWYDMVFSMRFEPKNRRRLPLSCLHLGDTKSNWKGRITPLWKPGLNKRYQDNFSSLLSLCELEPSDQVVFSGICEGKQFDLLTNYNCKLIAVSAWNNRPFSHRPGEQLALHSQVKVVESESADLFEDIADRSLKVIFIEGERNLEYWLNSIRKWEQKLDTTPFLPISDPFNGALKRPTQKANS